MRIFLAVFPSPEVQQTAARLGEVLREEALRVAWVQRENLHFTLRFLGEIDADGVRRAAEAAQETASAHAAFECELGGIGSFDSPRARVLWLGLIRGGPQLVALADSLAAALARRGFELDRRRFSPHLTIGRMPATPKDPTPRSPGAGALPTGERAFVVSRIALVESRLHPGGSIYRVLEEAPLGAH